MSSSSLQSHPFSSNIHSNKSRSSNESDNKDIDRIKSATLLLERSIRANPNDPFAWHLMGVHCHTEGSLDEALRCFSRAEQIKSGFSTSNQYYLAYCYKEKGNITESIVLLKSAIGLQTRNGVDKKAQKLAKQLLMELNKEGKK